MREDMTMEAKVREKEFKDAMMITLKVEEGSISQGTQATFRSSKMQGKEISLRVFRRNMALLTL